MHEQHELEHVGDYRTTLDVDDYGRLVLYRERFGHDPHDDIIPLSPRIVSQLLRLLPHYASAVDQLGALACDETST